MLDELPLPPSETQDKHRPKTARARKPKGTAGGGKRRPQTARGRKERGSDYVMPNDVAPNADNVIPSAVKRLAAGSRFTIRSGKKAASEVWQSGSDSMSTQGRWPQNRKNKTGFAIAMGRGSMWDKKREKEMEHMGPGQYDIAKALDLTSTSTPSFYIKEDKGDEKPFEDEKSGQLNTHELKAAAEPASSLVSGSHPCCAGSRLATGVSAR